MTKTAIVILCIDEILIWEIPPLLPQQPDLHHFLDNNSTHIPPLFKIPLPGDNLRHNREILGRMALSPWYLGSGFLESVYFNFFFTFSRIQKCKLIIKPDLNDANIHLINISGSISDDIVTCLAQLAQFNDCKHKICEDALVYLLNTPSRSSRIKGGYTELILTSAPSSNIFMLWNGPVESLCPTSGRFVYWPHRRDEDSSSSGIGIVDLF